MWSLMAILSTACLITVPLLNWSGTLRRLGAKFADVRDKKGIQTQSDIGTRTIVIYWAFLVLIGFICVWKQYYFSEGETNQEYPDMAKVVCRAGTNASMFTSSDGSLHRRAIDQTFVSENGCNNPCDQINIPSIFRQKSDLVLLNYKQALLWNGTLTAAKYNQVHKVIGAQNVFLEVKEYILLFVLLQGLITVCFGRRDPREIRDFIYIKLYMERPCSGKMAMLAMQDWSARVLGFLSYFVAVLMVIICAPLFIAVILEQEWGAAVEVPDAEQMHNIGQWQPWAIAGQILVVAFIWKYHDRFIAWMAISLRRIRDNCFGYQHHEEASSPEIRHSFDKSTDLEVGGRSKTNVNLILLAPSPACSQTNSVDKPSKHTWLQALKNAFAFTYYSISTPLNQSNQGIGDEIKNFYRWCKDPQRVSRRVIRHPIRARDSQTVKERAGPDQEETETFTPGMESSFFRGASVKRPRYPRSVT